MTPDPRAIRTFESERAFELWQRQRIPGAGICREFIGTLLIAQRVQVNELRDPFRVRSSKEGFLNTCDGISRKACTRDRERIEERSNVLNQRRRVIAGRRLF